MSPELVTAIAGGAATIAGAVAAGITRSRRRRQAAIAAPGPVTKPPCPDDLEERVRALEIALGKAEVSLERLDGLADQVYALAQAAARFEAQVQAARSVEHTLHAYCERIEHAIAEARRVALPPTREIPAAGGRTE